MIKPDPTHLRNEYLSQHWRPYELPGQGAVTVAQWQQGVRGEWVAGQISGWSVNDTGVALILQGQCRTAVIEAAQWQLFDYEQQNLFTNESVFGCLRVGDKVAIRQSGALAQIWLLAPNLGVEKVSALAFSVPIVWTQFLAQVRDFFTKQGFSEMETPTLVECPGLEPVLEPFATEVRWGSHKALKFLPTSPELHLKKFLAAGWTEIFELRKVFRNGEQGEHHDFEFTMLEWYRGYAYLGQIVEDTQGLISSLQRAGLVKGEVGEAQYLTVAEVWQHALDFKLTPQTTATELVEVIKRRDAGFVLRDETFNDLFFRLWVDFVDPWLALKKGLVFVRDWPPSQSALARLNDAGWTDRVELYWRGFEVANGYQELNNPQIQAERFARDLEERKRLGTSIVPLDKEFMQALEQGLPPCAGIAVGVDRLFMAAQNISDIKQLRPFRQGS